MSGIAGIIHFDGKPIEPGLIEKMTGAMAHRGPDGINHWVKGSVALGQCMLRTTPESLEEHQPLTNEDESLVLVMDGRVDNWEELRRELLSRRAILRNRSDAELVLRSYEVWGRDCLAHIDGDFALVIWDVRRREAFCARDRLGIKPLNYHWKGNVLSFASELQPLLGLPWVTRKFNTGMISEYLADSLISRDDTFFQDCFRLPAATTLMFGDSRKSTGNYWVPTDARELHLGAKDEYVDHLADLLAKATARRVRTISRVGVLLSGGVDSASVACFAQSEMMQRAAGGNFGIETFSLIFPGMACDEEQTIKEFLSRTGLRGHRLAANQPNLEGWRRNLELFKDFPDSPTGAAYYPLLKMASDHGCKVLLGGWGSDDWIGGGGGIYADLISRGGLSEIGGCFLQKIRQRGFRNALHLMFTYGVRPVVYHAILSATGLRYLPFRRHMAPPPWLGTAMAQEFQMRRELAMMNYHQATVGYHKAGLLRWLNSGMFALNAELQERSCAWHGIEGRYPFHDRSILEFAFALPDRVKWLLDRPKELLIRVTRQLFAPLFDHQFADLEGSPIYLNAVRSDQCRVTLESNRIAAIGWIKSNEGSDLYRNVLRWFDQGDNRYALQVRSLWQIIALDLWYQHIINLESINERKTANTERKKIRGQL